MQLEQKKIIQPKLFIWLAILVLLWLVFISLVPVEFKSVEKEGSAAVSFKAIAGNETVLDKTVQVENGTNAFEAMQTVATIGYQDYGEMGVMIESINGVKPKENEFWGLYVDGEMAMTGISAISIEKDTTIEWKIESFEAYTG